MIEHRADGTTVDLGVCQKCGDDGYVLDGRPATLDELIDAAGEPDGGRVRCCDCPAGQNERDSADEDDLGGEG